MKFFGYLLIFVLLLLTNLRVFFIKKTGFGSLVVLGPLSLLLTILMIFAWGFDMYSFVAIILSTFVTLTNFHALIRFNSKLYIDHFSNLMKFWAIITTIFSSFALIFIIIFFPVEKRTRDTGITERTVNFQGNFTSGFVPSTVFSEQNLIIHEYTLFPDFKTRKNVAILIPDKRADSINYRPYLQLVAKEGTTIVSADFYTKDSHWINGKISNSKKFRRTAMLFQSVKHNQDFLSFGATYTQNTILELEALLPILIQRYGDECSFFLISDGITDNGAAQFAKNHSDKIAGVFALDSIPEYKTAGYGCVEQTNPFLAKILGSSKDNSYFITRYLVLKSREAMRGAWLKK